MKKIMAALVSLSAIIFTLFPQETFLTFIITGRWISVPIGGRLAIAWN